MHARVTTLEIKPGQFDQVIALYKAEAVPTFKQQPGFMGLRLLTDREQNRMLSITYWETQDDLHIVEASLIYQQLVNKFAHLFTAPLQRQVYEVAVEE